MHIRNGMVKGFSKMYNLSFFGQFFFCKHFYYITGCCKKKFIFCKFAIFFADSKSTVRELSNDVSFVIFRHQTWDLEGGGPPQRILVFKYPSRDRVKRPWIIIIKVQSIRKRLVCWSALCPSVLLLIRTVHAHWTYFNIRPTTAVYFFIIWGLG